MFEKFLNFIKYNNSAILILAIIFILGASTFAATTTGALGQRTTKITGVDNTLLLSTDMDKLDMGFKIEKVEQDEKYYYVTYTYLDLGIVKSVWQYELKEKVMQVSKSIEEDLGTYLAGKFGDILAMRIKELKAEQETAKNKGVEKRIAVTEYSGLIGKTLNTVAGVFPGYEPVKKAELPSPQAQDLNNYKPDTGSSAVASSPDNLSNIYSDYVTKNDPDHDNYFGASDNCPTVYNPTQLDSNNNGIGDACDTATGTPNPATDATVSTGTPDPGSVQVMDLGQTASGTGN